MMLREIIIFTFMGINKNLRIAEEERKAKALETTLKNFETISKPIPRPKKLKKIQEGKILRETKKK